MASPLEDDTAAIWAGINHHCIDQTARRLSYDAVCACQICCGKRGLRRKGLESALSCLCTFPI